MGSIISMEEYRKTQEKLEDTEITTEILIGLIYAMIQYRNIGNKEMFSIFRKALLNVLYEHFEDEKYSYMEYEIERIIGSCSSEDIIITITKYI